MYGAYLLGMGTVLVSLFAVALAGTGLLTTVGVIVSMDTFGPVSDNAQGIAEMSGDIDEKGARVLTDLDAVGNTTKAITKGIAIATAVLAATALFGSFTDVGTRRRCRPRPAPALSGRAFSLDSRYPERPGRPDHRRRGRLPVQRPGHQRRVAGPPDASSSRCASSSAPSPGSWTAPSGPTTARVVDICTADSLRELITPGTLAVLAPIAVGFGLGIRPAGRLPRPVRSPAVC